MKYLKFLIAASVGFMANPSFAQTCGDADNACEISDGTYHIAMPSGTPVGIVMHLHGGGGYAAAMLNSQMSAEAAARDYIFVAPQGFHPNSRFVRNWSVKANNSFFERDDVAFLENVLADVHDRHGGTDVPVVLSGFSRGGSMVWDVACETPDFADAYAPMAGAFWDDLPDSCEGPVRLFHTHGWSDRVVPLEGRSFSDGAVVQGDVWASMKIMRETNECGNRQPESSRFEGAFWFRTWTDCDAGQMELMLHQGGHGAPDGWAGYVLDWFEAG